MRKIVAIVALILLPVSLDAQTEGNNVFGPDQVLQVHVDFYASDFWNQLNEEYNGDQNYIPASITIVSENGTSVLDSVGIRLKGNSSMGHPGNKKSFKVDFNRYIPSQAYDLLKKLNFNNGFKDPTFVREKLFFDVCESAGILAPRATFAEVSFNGTPWGFYTVVEQIDDQFLDRSIGDDDGSLFKAGSNFGVGDDEASLMYLGLDSVLYENAYELKMNGVNDWGELIEFLEFINTTSDDAFENDLGNHLDLLPYLRSAALDNLFANLDSYSLSARNYYLYRNTTLNRWQWIKWDANEAFGSYSMGVPGPMTELNLAFDGGNFDRPLLERIMASEALRSAYYAELCDLRANHFNTEELAPRLSALKALIQESVYSDANKMYSNADFDANFNSNLSSGGGPGGQLYGLTSFIELRSEYVDDELDCATLGLVELENPRALQVFPNPSSNQVTLAWNSAASSGELRVFDSMGRVVGHWPQFRNGMMFHHQLPPGYYLIQVRLDSGIHQERLQVIR